MAAVVLAVGLAALSAPPSNSDGEGGTAHGPLVVGEALRVDLGRRALLVKVGGREPREIELTVDDATRFTAAGRDVRLEDVRPGDRVVASSTELEGGRRPARLVRAGEARAAVAVPSPARP